MTDNNDIAWKQFETIVARLEASLAGQGVVVKSPDKVPDLQTGKLREVDATIRREIGSANVLITIECRRRNSVQDVTWIEQLATKKRKIGAALTIAVSSLGFSDSAITTASQEGIVIRSFEELEQDNLSWLQLAFHDLILVTLTITDIGLELYDPDVTDEMRLDSTLQAECESKDIEYPLFIKLKDESRYPPSYIFEMAKVHHGFDPYKDCPDVGEHQGSMRWECYDRGIGVETSNGIKPAKNIFLKYLVKSTTTSMPISNVFRYSSSDKAIAEGIEFNMPTMNNGKLLMYKDHRSGHINVSIGVDSSEDKITRPNKSPKPTQ